MCYFLVSNFDSDSAMQVTSKLSFLFSFLFSFFVLSYAELASLTLVFFFGDEVGYQTNSVEIQMLCDESRFLADEARQISALLCAIC